MGRICKSRVSMRQMLLTLLRRSCRVAGIWLQVKFRARHCLPGRAVGSEGAAGLRRGIGRRLSIWRVLIGEGHGITWREGWKRLTEILTFGLI